MPVEKSQLSRGARALYRVGNLFARGAIGAVMLLPYRWRIPAMGWLVTHTVAPLAGFNRRIARNLSLTVPGLNKPEVRRLCAQVCDNTARTSMEQLSTVPFMAQAARTPISGPGWPAIQQAAEQGRPVIVCSGHFGNYAIVRAAMAHAGHPMGVIYRRLANPYFNDYYVDRLERLGGTCFEQGHKGMRGVVKHLRGGGKIGILTDLHAHGGEELSFFGQPAVTSTATAEMALKFNALLVPGYAIRQPDGLSFQIEFHDPIPHTDARMMTQAMNDDLEALVRQHMGQWFWIHRRWKPWVSQTGEVRGLPNG